jgi:hypothetical protein
MGLTPDIEVTEIGKLPHFSEKPHASFVNDSRLFPKSLT